MNFNQFPCSWIRIQIRVLPNTDTDPEEPNQCGSIRIRNTKWKPVFFFSRNAAAKALIDQIDLSSLPTREASHSEDPLPYLKYMHVLFTFLAKKCEISCSCCSRIKKISLICLYQFSIVVYCTVRLPTKSYAYGNHKKKNILKPGKLITVNCGMVGVQEQVWTWKRGFRRPRGLQGREEKIVSIFTFCDFAKNSLFSEH